MSLLYGIINFCEKMPAKGLSQMGIAAFNFMRSLLTDFHMGYIRFQSNKMKITGKYDHKLIRLNAVQYMASFVQ